MKKIICIVITLSMVFSTVVSYGTDSLTIKQEDDYLYKARVLTNHTHEWEYQDPVTRAEATTVIARIMRATNPYWEESDQNPYSDVPSWAKPYVSYAYANGIIRGVDAVHFKPNNHISKNDFMTMLLRALGYGSNDSIQEFTWNNAFDFALSVGVIDQKTYDFISSKKPIPRGDTNIIFTRGDMIMLTYSAFKEYNNNPYTDAYLSNLVENNKLSAENIETLHNLKILAPDNLRQSTRYFTMFYPDNEKAKACAGVLLQHADKVYAMLQDLYGIQPVFDVYLVDAAYAESGIRNTNSITKNDHTTYIVYDDVNDKNDNQANNIAEMVEELNKVFYYNLIGETEESYLTSKSSKTAKAETPWMVNATNKVIASLYTKHNFKGEIDKWSLYEQPSMRMNLRDFASNPNASAKNASDERSELTQIYYYTRLVNSLEPSEFKGFLSTIVVGKEPISKEQLVKKSVLEIDGMFKQ